jgi:hypothetical protein
VGLLSGDNIPSEENNSGGLQSRKKGTEPRRDFSAIETNDEKLADVPG